MHHTPCLTNSLIPQTRSQIGSLTSVHYRYAKRSTSHPDTVSNHEPDRSSLPVTKESQINIQTVNHFAHSDTKHSELTSVTT